MKRLALVVSDPSLRADLQRTARAAGYAVQFLPADAVSARVGADAVIVDVAGPRDLQILESFRREAPDIPVIAIGSDSSFEAIARARRAGAREFLRKPFEVTTLERVLAVAMPPEPTSGAERFFTREPAVLRLLAEVERAAATEATIRIRGESGTGKELLARWIHRHSLRRAGPFVVVGCAGLSESLAESELLGHERGAFTGAIDARPGQVRASSGGTLVLDDVSELAATLQPKLLRVLQEREVTSVGSSLPSPVDLRVVATTRCNLVEEVAAGRFREDLFYRLDVIEFEIPPLRERPNDIELLAKAMLQAFARRQGDEPPQLGDDALAALRAHPFRGNVRELSNLMRRATILFAGREIDAETLLAHGPARAVQAGSIDSLNLRELERDAVIRALAAHDGNRTRAAKALGISVRTLRNKIRLYELNDESRLDPATPAGWVSV